MKKLLLLCVLAVSSQLLIAENIDSTLTIVNDTNYSLSIKDLHDFANESHVWEVPQLNPKSNVKIDLQNWDIPETADRIQLLQLSIAGLASFFGKDKNGKSVSINEPVFFAVEIQERHYYCVPRWIGDDYIGFCQKIQKQPRKVVLDDGSEATHYDFTLTFYTESVRKADYPERNSDL